MQKIINPKNPEKFYFRQSAQNMPLFLPLHSIYYAENPAIRQHKANTVA